MFLVYLFIIDIVVFFVLMLRLVLGDIVGYVGRCLFLCWIFWKREFLNIFLRIFKLLNLFYFFIFLGIK